MYQGTGDLSKAIRTFNIQLLAGFGPIPIQSVINLAAFIREDLLMVAILQRLLPNLLKLSKGNPVRAFNNIDQLITRAYEHHLYETLEDPSLQTDFLSLLDSMIEGGSSDAFWIREFMISFPINRLSADIFSMACSENRLLVK
ncbi:hypothetical protein GJU39_18860 [Pedobacter petrophilus]|uniref:Uncharacterized protein n=1 Tax=Pedobacter petrophilus TaxID=1908241 RepID=A0A7K0G421_9SPHI|nr:hypothetical protein [Pedobacter petrophilus]MRX78144.1 hypothetical protein [Pedobacter petrophilus]